ncbi:MAG TPA: adenylate/guanylate cyclase domain-containing protein, partial [Acidimicrobiales bacterium]|nr:adenylate/guanylate cyclase domain-containing protein [Acidimicrobiales bacterium]
MRATEFVAVLFTDLVGSTQVMSSLESNAADELLRGHLALLRHTIAAEGGTEVKNLGDGVMVVFPTPSSALACAVSMQQV